MAADAKEARALLGAAAVQQIDALLKERKTKQAAGVLNDLGARESDIRKARTILGYALSIQPDHFESLANLALVNLEDATLPLAEKLAGVQRALAVNEAWFQGKKTEASLLDDLGKEQEAIQAYKQAVELSPGDVDCLYDLALLVSRAGSLDEAIALAKRAIRLNSKHAAANCLLAEVMWRSGRHSANEVVRFAQKAIQSESASDAVKYSAYLVAASASEQTEKPENAVPFLEGALTLKSLNPDLTNVILIRLSGLYSRFQNEEKARAMIKRIDCRSDDKVGEALISAYLGLPLSEEQGNETDGLSALCECFLLNARLDNPKDLIHKARLYLRLLSAKQMDVVPDSCIINSKERLVEMSKEWSSEESPILFLKNPAVQRGQGITIISKGRVEAALASSELWQGAQQQLLLQKGIHPPRLLEGRKFGLRVHCLLVCFPMEQVMSVYVFEDAILTKCWLPYSTDSTDPLVHISSTSVQRQVEGFDRSKSKGLASRLMGEDYSAKFITSMRKKVLAACEACREVHDLSQKRTLVSMQLFGFDIIVRDDLETFIAEANASPQFQDSKKTSELLSGFARPMINGVASILAKGYDGRESFIPSISAPFNRWVFAGDISSQ